MENMNATGFLIVKGLLVLALLWAAVWGAMSVAGVFEVTEEKVTAFVEAVPFSEIRDPAQRRERLERIADMINKLAYDQRREFREKQESKRERSFFENLNQQEKLHLVDATTGNAFRQMMEAFNEMDPEERRKYVERARGDLVRREGGQRDVSRIEDEDRKVYDRIVEEGLRAYYQDASADTKLDLAPLMEELHHLMKQW